MTTPLRTAIIGYGTAGRVFHAPLVAHEPRLSLDAIVTTSDTSKAQIENLYPGTAVLPSADAVFDAADDYDLVVIATPNVTHADFARRAIDAGLHIVIDKPIAVTSEEADALIQSASAAGVRLSVFQNRRWDGDFLTVRAAIAAGAVGDVRQFESAFEWWKPELGKAWKDQSGHGEGGGILYDLGPHLIDQALQLFGSVDRVHAELDTRREGAAGDDDSFVTLHHASGVRTRLWMNAVSPANRPRFRVVGSTSVLTTWGLDPQEPQSMAGVTPDDPRFGLHDDGRGAVIDNTEGTSELPLQAGAYTEYYRGIAAAVIDGAPLPVEPDDAVTALRLIEQAVASAR